MNNTKYYKRKANKAVRKASKVGNGGDYKKAYESWNIKDQ